ncbi:transcriptional regulator TACO1-like protein [Cyathus striatus]|nr:transcriptional regulator TACO1-like protein [Cyathus striatus]
MCNSPLRTVLRRSFSISRPTLAGHNKWSKIKEKKGANDQQKSLIYGRANKEIVIAVRTGGSADPVKNLQLAGAIKRAKDQGVPKENIAKALEKAIKGKEGNGEIITYEALAFNSVGLMIECMTDNSNRSLSRVREILGRHESRLAPVKFMFQRRGRVKVAIPRSSDMQQTDSLIEMALGHGAEDFEEVENEVDMKNLTVYNFICPPEELNTLTESLAAYCVNLDAKLLESGLIYSSTEPGQPDEETGSKLTTLIDALEDDGDTFHVWTSLD